MLKYALIDVKASYIVYQSIDYKEVLEKMNFYVKRYPELEFVIVKTELLFYTKNLIKQKV